MKMIVHSALPSWSPPSLQNKKIHPEKNSLCFQKWNFLALILKKFLYFLKGKLFLYFWKWNHALFSPKSEIKKILHPKNSYTSGNKQEIRFCFSFYIFFNLCRYTVKWCCCWFFSKFHYIFPTVFHLLSKKTCI